MVTSEELQKLLDEATPGPWTACETDQGGVGEGAYVTVDDGAATVAHVLCYRGRSLTRRPYEGNCRLIAAAPDLAAELIRVRQERDELREALQDIADGMGEADLAQIGRFAPAIARAALAKWGTL